MSWPKSPREIARDTVAAFHAIMASKVPGHVAKESAYTVAIEAVVETLLWQFVEPPRGDE